MTVAPDPDKVSSTIHSLERELRQHQDGSLVQVLLRRLAGHEAAIAALAKQVEVLEAALRARDILLEAPCTDDTRYPQHATVCADHHLPARDGFYGIEHSDTGLPYRWTGPSRSFGFEVFVDRSEPLVASLYVVAAPARLDLGAVRATCDNRALATTFTERHGQRTIEVLLPTRSAVGRTRIDYELPSIYQPSRDAPADSDAPADNRLLGLAFARLELRPAPQRDVSPANSSGQSRTGGGTPTRTAGIHRREERP